MVKFKQKHKSRLHKKWGFPLRIGLVNVITSAVSCESGHIYWRSSKNSFLVQLNESFWILNSIILSFNLHSICSLPIQYVQTFISSSKLSITNLHRWFIACAIVLLYHLPFPFHIHCQILFSLSWKKRYFQVKGSTLWELLIHPFFSFSPKYFALFSDIYHRNWNWVFLMVRALNF